MANHDIEPWRPGDRFVIREPTANGVPEPRFYDGYIDEVPDPLSPTRYIPRANVNLTIIYTVTAVYEEANQTFIRFDNKEEYFFGRRAVQHTITMEGEACETIRTQELVNSLEGPSESLWIMARFLKIPFCRKVRILSMTPRRSTRPIANQAGPRQRSRS